MKIRTIKGLRMFITQNTFFSKRLVNNIIKSLGFQLNGTWLNFMELSAVLVDCARYSAEGIQGFDDTETFTFFKSNRQDIINHMEETVAEMGVDIINMVKNFGIFHHSKKPTTGEVGRALWDKCRYSPELDNLYNVFAWYALEELSNSWYKYLMKNPVYMVELEKSE